ncbi:MAG: hypothetical protein HYY64_13750 [Candidatus Rokubacteria bacterium]|nr:hypothetical protein [Candidatus Rokubacteria bacterium]
MRRTTRTLVVLPVLVALMLTIAPLPAWAVCAVTDAGAIPGLAIDQNASGTKVSGPLSLFYQNLQPEPTVECPLGEGNITVVLRLRKGNDERVFGTGPIPNVCFTDFATIAQVIQGLVDAEVPLAFGFTDATVKSVTDFIFNAENAVSMDIELALR